MDHMTEGVMGYYSGLHHLQILKVKVTNKHTVTARIKLTHIKLMILTSRDNGSEF